MNSLNKLQILKKRLIDFKLVQGPLAGVSHHVFREGVWAYSEPAWVCSEMISCQTIANGSKALHQRFLGISKNEGPLCLQIAASSEKDIKDAFGVINTLNVALVDLNAGCPVQKVRKRGMGSALLESPDRLLEVLLAMRDHSAVPISVKIRLQQDQSKDDRVLAVIHKANVDFLTVHGRTYLDGYDVAVNHARIGYFAKNARIPVLGNVDVCDATSAHQMLSVGVSGVMVGRFGVGQPWLIGDIQRSLGFAFGLKSTHDRNPAKLFFQHVERMCKLPGGEKFAILSGYGLIKYFAKRHQMPPEIIEQVRQCKTLLDLGNAMIRYY